MGYNYKVLSVKADTKKTYKTTSMHIKYILRLVINIKSNS
jgi:hypothetical protein